MPMPQENDATFSPDFMRRQLKVMADIEVSGQAVEQAALFGALVATMNILQPEGYSETFPAFTFKPVKE
jgi:hypothetical protein